MLAVAKKPRIKVSAEVIPESLLDFLRKNFGGVEINPETYTPENVTSLCCFPF